MCCAHVYTDMTLVARDKQTPTLYVATQLSLRKMELSPRCPRLNLTPEYIVAHTAQLDTPAHSSSIIFSIRIQKFIGRL